MKFTLDPSASLPIACPKCGKEETHLVAQLRSNPQLTCSCGASWRLDAGHFDAVIKVLEGLNR